MKTKESDTETKPVVTFRLSVGSEKAGENPGGWRGPGEWQGMTALFLQRFFQDVHGSSWIRSCQTTAESTSSRNR